MRLVLSIFLLPLNWQVGAFSYCAFILYCTFLHFPTYVFLNYDQIFVLLIVLSKMLTFLHFFFQSCDD